MAMDICQTLFPLLTHMVLTGDKSIRWLVEEAFTRSYQINPNDNYLMEMSETSFVARSRTGSGPVLSQHDLIKDVLDDNQTVVIGKNVSKITINFVSRNKI